MDRVKLRGVSETLGCCFRLLIRVTANIARKVGRLASEEMIHLAVAEVLWYGVVTPQFRSVIKRRVPWD